MGANRTAPGRRTTFRNHNQNAQREYQVIWYCDSSALMKRYVREVGSAWLRQQIGQHRLIASSLVLAEMASAVTRRWRKGTISEIEFHRVRSQFQRHVRAQSYSLLAAPLDLIDQAT